MASAVKVLQRLLTHPSLYSNLQFHQIQRFFELTHRIWPNIVKPGELPPTTLPPLVLDFLAAALSLKQSEAHLIWCVFSDLAETFHQEAERSDSTIDDVFRIHSLKSSIGSISPPCNLIALTLIPMC
ncbi:hypothetical protein R3P38DRAFT_3223655 [Favolaschia claudopus]|uniref:Huntingtin n=1 Tax=Favolaschia claudopus TaxID=2862362 RepID=A0AAV9ZYD7_9AGAR